ncbi:G-protein coupled receptor-associated protein LMBRD2, partial [Geodia barretti]
MSGCSYSGTFKLWGQSFCPYVERASLSWRVPYQRFPLYLANLPVCDDVIVWSVRFRSLWNASRRSYTLSHCYFKAAKLCTDMSEADEKLSDAVERVNKVTQRLHYNDPLRKYVDIIIKKFPEEVQAEFNKGHDDYEDYRETSGEDSLCKSSLEKLLKQSMKAVRMSRSTHISHQFPLIPLSSGSPS